MTARGHLVKRHRDEVLRLTREECAAALRCDASWLRAVERGTIPTPDWVLRMLVQMEQKRRAAS